MEPWRQQPGSWPAAVFAQGLTVVIFLQLSRWNKMRPRIVFELGHIRAVFGDLPAMRRLRGSAADLFVASIRRSNFISSSCAVPPPAVRRRGPSPCYTATRRLASLRLLSLDLAGKPGLVDFRCQSYVICTCFQGLKSNLYRVYRFQSKRRQFRVTSTSVFEQGHCAVLSFNLS